MAEIALLVAEDYERMKRWHGGGEAEQLDCALSPYFASLDRKEEKAEVASPFRREEGAVAVAVAVAVRGLAPKRALEPRSPLGLAAMEGFFPA